MTQPGKGWVSVQR